MPENLEIQPVVLHHPDDEENELAPDEEVDALVKGIDPSTPVSYGEDDV